MHPQPTTSDDDHISLASFHPRRRSRLGQSSHVHFPPTSTLSYSYHSAVALAPTTTTTQSSSSFSFHQVGLPGFPFASSPSPVPPLLPPRVFPSTLTTTFSLPSARQPLACLLHSTPLLRSSTHPSETRPHSFAATPPASHPLPPRPHRARHPTCHCAACPPTPATTSLPPPTTQLPTPQHTRHRFKTSSQPHSRHSPPHHTTPQRRARHAQQASNHHSTACQPPREQVAAAKNSSPESSEKATLFSLPCLPWSCSTP